MGELVLKKSEMSRTNKNIRQIVSNSRQREGSTKALAKVDQADPQVFAQRTNVGNHIMPQGTYHTSIPDSIKAPSGIPSTRPPLLNSMKSSKANLQVGAQKNNSAMSGQSRVMNAGKQIVGGDNGQNQKDEGVAVPTSKKDYEPLVDSQMEGMSVFDLKQNYMDIRKEFLNKKLTVNALQRNFEVLSKLCVSEQEGKQQLIEQNKEFGKDIKDKASRLCDLHDQVAELEKQKEEFKAKALVHDKMQFEMKQLQSQLNAAKSDAENKEFAITDLKKKLSDQKSEFKSVADQFGNHEDAMAAAEFRAEGLLQDLKDAEKLIEQLKSEALQSKYKLTDSDDMIVRMQQDIERVQSVVKEKDMIVEKKERLIQEYKSDLEKERREKSDQSKKIKELEKHQEESKYMLMKEGNSTNEQSRRIDELTQMLSKKQRELEDYSKETETLREWLQCEKQEVQRLNSEQSKIMVKKKESEMKIGDQSKKLEFVSQSIQKFKNELAEKEKLLSNQRSEMLTMQQEYDYEIEKQAGLKENQRVQYMQAIEKQKEEIASLNNRLLHQGKSGQDADERSRTLEEETSNLRQQLRDSETQMKQQTCEMAEQINTYKQKLNMMLDQLEGKESMIKSKEDMLKSKEEAIEQQQDEMQKHKDNLTKLDRDLLNKQNTVQQLQEQTHEIAKQKDDILKQKEEYASMANQLESRLAKTMDELSDARKQKSMQNVLTELQEKLDAESKNANVAREQKAEMSSRMEQLMKDKKKAMEDLGQAQYSSKTAREAMEVADRKLKESLNMATERMREHMGEKEQMSKTINQQKEAVVKSHKEVDELKSSVNFWKGQMDSINEKFGGYNEIESQIRIAKLKEGAVGNLWQKLNTCIQSTEGNLQCFKCIEIATEPVVLIPCGHLMCKGCVPNDRICPDCSTPFTQKVSTSFVKDLINKHEFSKDALSAFKNDKTWENVLKKMT